MCVDLLALMLALVIITFDNWKVTLPERVVVVIQREISISTPLIKASVTCGDFPLVQAQVSAFGTSEARATGTTRRAAHLLRGRSVFHLPVNSVWC